MQRAPTWPWRSWWSRTNGWRWRSVPVRVPRLPGVRFESQPATLVSSLPRMDIAMFVGFAAAGPLDQAVAIEDPAQFANVFGGDLQLAWDNQRGALTYAHLGPAVRAFFRNGGKRCWVIRVARRPVANRFEVPGLMEVDLATGIWRPALVEARSGGSWSDGIRIATALLTEPVRATSAWTVGSTLNAIVT